METTNHKSQSCYNLNDSATIFLVALVLPIAVALVFSVVMAIFTQIIQTSINTTLYNVFYFCASAGASFLLFYMYNKNKKINIYKASQIKFKLSVAKVALVVALATASVFLVSGFVGLLDHLYTFFGFDPSNALTLELNNVFMLIVGVITMAVFPAITEELIFRGIVFNGLKSGFNKHAAVFLSAAMFMLMHGSLQQTFYQFFLGVVLGYIMLYTKNILYPIIFHFVNNFIVVAMSYYYTVNNISVDTPVVYNGAFDYILPILLMLVASGLVVGVVFLFKHLNNKEEKAFVSTDIEDLKINEDQPQAIEVLEQSTSTVKTSYGKNLLLIGILIASVMWVINTLSIILGGA